MSYGFALRLKPFVPTLPSPKVPRQLRCSLTGFPGAEPVTHRIASKAHIRFFSFSQPLAAQAPLRKITPLQRRSRNVTVNMESNGDHRAKRKQAPTSTSGRPTKQLRSAIDVVKMEEGSNTSGDETYPDAPINGVEFDMEDPRSSKHAAATADTAEWQATIEKVVKSVVSIHFCQTCSFDTDPALSSEATGFVVDAQRGYILTNRHVVGAGPFWGYCIFDNHEECDVYPVYRDPVHDFGILRFEPSAIKYMQLSELRLRPDLARVGAEIRVVGNDAGEKLSILSGVISRLDRNAPEYSDGYSDFNTNYIQAAAAASGGSSGSPVVNIDGYAVALQAGGRADGAATDYFLPLDRALRALDCIRRDEDVSRGTIQTQWLIKPFDECRRLGLSAEWEAAIRKEFPKEIGMLVAEIILPKGPAALKIEEGDVLVKVNGEFLTQFVNLDDILDSSVGKSVTLLVQRGGEDIEVTLQVGDLHTITPDRFVSVAGATFHNLSYQQARLYAVGIEDAGVYCCEAAGSFRYESAESGWLIQTVNNKETPNLDAFINVMKDIPDRARVVITYKHLRDLHTLHTSIIPVDRHWSSKLKLAVRNDKTGLWDFTDIAEPLPPTPPVSRKANFIKMESTKYPAAADIVRSFVRITASMPIKLDGFPRTRKVGYGLVIDAEKGLVIVSRAIVPYDLCDISVTVADSIIVDGSVVFMHPLQNYAIIQYDPSLVQAPVKSAKLSSENIKQGAEAIFFGFNQNMRPNVVKTAVTDITTVAIPASVLSPRYRAINLDAITVDTSVASHCGSGVLVSEDGTVNALWLSYLGERNSPHGKDVEYHLGLATPALLPIVNQITQGIKPSLRILAVETHIIHMSQARIMGVSEKWIEKVEQEDPERHQLFMVRKIDSGHEGGLHEGDIILTLNDRLITRVSNLDLMYDHTSLDAVIVRKRKEIRIQVPTIPTQEFETDHAVVFCGAILHRPHHAVRQQISKIHSDIYVSARMRGSPAYQYGLAPTNFITAVNATPTRDLKSFLEETNKIPDNTYFRLKVVTFDNVRWVVTMKKCEHYFPTVEFIKDEGERCHWRRVTYEGGMQKQGEGEGGAGAMVGGQLDDGDGAADDGVDGEGEG